MLKHRLRLVVGMMCGSDRREPALLCPSLEHGIASRARLALQISRFDRTSQNRMRNAPILAQRLNEARFACTLLPEPVIDRRRLDPARQRSLRQQHQCDTVRAARYRDAEFRIRPIALSPDRCEIAGEAFGQLRIGRAINCR